MTPSDEPTPLEHPAPAHFTTDEPSHPDPITGEPGAHPVGVGVGAVGAGIAGAAIGMVAGPLGALIGAAIGAVAGGLAGKEVAASDDEPLPADREPEISPSETAGFESTGLPTASLGGTSGTSVLAAGSERGAEDDVAGSHIGGPIGVSAGQFHDAFTATTLHETEAEDQMTDGTDSDEIPLSGSVLGNSVTVSTSFGHAGERDESVRKTAYFLFLDRQQRGVPGDELGDWLSAEHESSLV